MINETTSPQTSGPPAQTLGGCSGGPLVRSTAAPATANRDACGFLMLARQAHVDGVALLKLMHFSGALAAYLTAWNMRQIGANPLAALQIDGRSYAPLAAIFLQFLCRKSVCSVQNWRWAFWGKKGRFYEGKIKEDGTMSGRFWKLSLSAHWLGNQFRHHRFEGRRAATSRKALALLDFDQHQRSKSPDFPHFGV